MGLEGKTAQTSEKTLAYSPTVFTVVNSGGVEDIRLEAKAKVTKKPRPKPKTALPRTDTLDAKDRNARGQGQGPRTQTQVFSKKRSSKFFFRRSTKF